MHRLLLLCSLLTFFTAFAQNHEDPSRSSVDTLLAPFYHGVASGDPLSDRVILWTRITTSANTADVNWQIATDTSFSNVVNSGTVTTDDTRDYTVKVDATGLQSGTWYYYRFSNNGKYSIPGRTKTAPSGDVDSLRFAVVACSNYQAGFFNVYRDIALRNDVDAVLHLGDYYYEYEPKGYGYDGDSTRLHEPDHEVLTLADYRMRHSQYKLDGDLRYCHQLYPFICEWDDHESANNSWYGGAENHTPGTEGNWFTRKSYAQQAYFEWLPIREVAAGNDTVIHRKLPYGDLLDFIMVDTRLEGRDTSLGIGIPQNNPVMNDTNRTLLGIGQLNWFKTQLSTSTARWKVIGNQVMVAPLLIPFVNYVLSGDQWDGYPAERKKIYNHIMQNNIGNVVFLTGDIHSSWGADLPHPDSTYDKNTGAGSVATEFVCTSVTSPSFDQLTLLPVGTVQQYNPWFKYVEYTKRGYLLLDINKTRVQGDWIHMSTVTSRIYTASDVAQWMNLNGERFLRQAPAALGPRLGFPGLLPFVTAINDEQKDHVVMVGCYPNPFVDEIVMQYYLSKPGTVNVKVIDLNGRTVYSSQFKQTQSGLFNSAIRTSDLGSGTYVVSLTMGEATVSKQIVKTR